MVRQRYSIGHILIPVGLSLLLAVLIAAFLGGDIRAKIIICGAALLILFVSLIYFQLRFYREGDRNNIRNHRELPSMDFPSVPRFLKSPYHRAIWQNIEQSRALMRHKEEEGVQAQTIKEKQTLRLPQEETILFMADRSRLCCWPIPFLSLILLFIAALFSEESPAALSFVCLILGLFGLLLSTAAGFQIRYYITNFRILIRKRLPMGKARWSSLNYQEVFSLLRQRKFAREELTLKSDKGTINIRGLSKQKLQTVLYFLNQQLPVHVKE